MSIKAIILLSIDAIIISGQKCSFEKLLQKCFEMSPETLAFSHFKKCPDARKIDRPLRTLRKEKLIKGTPQTSFSLTKSGKKAAQEAANVLRQKKLEFSK